MMEKAVDEGVRVSLDLGQSFANVASSIKGATTPSAVLDVFGKALSKIEKPIPAGKLLGMVTHGAGEMGFFNKENAQQGANALVAGARELAPYLLDDAQLDRGEIVEIAGNVASRINADVDPDPAIVNKASETLRRLGIEDPAGTRAVGLGKAAVIGSIAGQFLDYSHQHSPEPGYVGAVFNEENSLKATPVSPDNMSP